MKHIKCKTEKQMRKVLKKLENDGYRWAGRTKPTGYVPFNTYKEDTVIRANDECRELTYCSYDYFTENNVKVFIDAEDFVRVRDEKNRPSIVIFRRGREVIAKDVATGNKGIAKCSPNDEFCFKTGASIALARLMAKTPEILTDDVRVEWKKALGIEDIPARVDHKFNVGDFVTLKEGIEANKKYGGLPLLEGAMYDNAYNKRMTVVRVDWSDDFNTYYCECKGDSQFTFHYSEEMLDKWEKSKIHEGDTVKVINTGLNYSSYPQWVGEHISDPYMAARYCYGSPYTDRKYKVIKIADHESNGRTLAYIEACDEFVHNVHNRCYLIEVEGLEKV